MARAGDTEDYWAELRDKRVAIYARKSGKEQQGIPSQIEECKSFLKRNKFKRKPKIFKEQISGAKTLESREALAECVSMILASDRPSEWIILMRDFTRFSRMGLRGCYEYMPLYEQGVELVSVNSNVATGTPNRPDSRGLFDFLLWMSLGTLEREEKRTQSIAGSKKAALAGIWSGRFLDLDKPWRWTAENLYRRHLPTDDPNYIARKTMASDSGASLGWFKKAEVRLNKIRDYGIAKNIPDALEQYVSALEYLNQVKKKYGYGSHEFKATRYIMSGYVMKPEKFWVFNPDEQRRAEIILSPKEYLPKDKW